MPKSIVPAIVFFLLALTVFANSPKAQSDPSDATYTHQSEVFV